MLAVLTSRERGSVGFWGGWVFAATAMVAVAICVDEGSLTSAGMVAVAGLGMIRLLNELVY